MKHLSWIITIPVTVVAVVFAVANRDEVLLRFWPLPWSRELPVYLIVLGCLFVGFVLGCVVTWLSSAPRRRRARRTADRARELARELAELKRQQAIAEEAARPGSPGGTLAGGTPVAGSAAGVQPPLPAFPASGRDPAALERLHGG